MHTNKRQRVLILGAGFGGLAAARRLRRNPDVTVTLIDRGPAHTFYSMLYEVATGFMHGRDILGEAALARGVSISYERILSRWGCGYVRATVTAVDLGKKIVRTDDGDAHAYDYLIVSFGFAPDFFGIAGLQERAFTLSSLADALAVRSRIMGYLDRKKRGQEVSLRIMIGGGGATGVETAAELANFFHGRQKAGELHSGDWSIRLVEASPRLLSMLPPDASAAALKRLEQLGVKVMLDTCIKRVEDHHVILTPRPLRPGESLDALVCEFRAEAERAFEAEVVIWCGGIRGSASTAMLGLALDRKGRIPVDPTMAAAAPDVFVVGDCAALVDPESGKPVPNLAQSAAEMGALAGENILRRVHAQPPQSFVFHTYATVIPLGGKNALAHFGTWYLSGLPGYVVRQAASFRYWLTILPFAIVLRDFVRSTFSYMSND
ncbi:MAG: FAD-dependent oxidoreductase [Patescibacteria group bacterium]